MSSINLMKKQIRARIKRLLIIEIYKVIARIGIACLLLYYVFLVLKFGISFPEFSPMKNPGVMNWLLAVWLLNKHHLTDSNFIFGLLVLIASWASIKTAYMPKKFIKRETVSI